MIHPCESPKLQALSPTQPAPQQPPHACLPISQLTGHSPCQLALRIADDATTTDIGALSPPNPPHSQSSPPPNKMSAQQKHVYDVTPHWDSPRRPSALAKAHTPQLPLRVALGRLLLIAHLK